jgi:hypothetical protein
VSVLVRPARRLVEGPREPSDKMICRAVGEELRRTREALGWSRARLVRLLPSGIGDRTLLSYEHGSRHCTVVRLIEITRAMEVDTTILLSRALQRARIHVETMTLHVDLRKLLRDKNANFRPMFQWARNALNEHPDGVACVEPAVVRHLALFTGCSHRDLANYLTRFTPEVGGEEMVRHPQ